MNRKLSAYEKKVFRYCGEVMHYVWDPIGIAGTPQARDEYDSYVPSVVSLLLSDAKAESIAAHLTRLTTDPMGMSPNRQRDLETAELLLEWLQVLRDEDPTISS